MRILVTGGLGFIGGHLAEELAGSGHDIVVLDSLESQVHSNQSVLRLPPGVTVVKRSVSSIGALKEVMHGVDVAYHFAAQVGVGQSMYDIPRYVDTNIGGTGQLLQSIIDMGGGLKRLVVAASMSSYGEGAYSCSNCGVVHPPLRSTEQLVSGSWEVNCPRCKRVATPVATPEDKPMNCNSVYALTKRVQEELCLLLGKTYGIPVVSLRFFNAYGPRQSLNNPYTGVCAIFQSRIKNGVSPIVFEDGQQTRDFVSVHDIVRACTSLLSTSAADYESLNIGSGQPTTIEGIAKLLSELHHSGISPMVTNQFRKGDVRHCFADISKARRTIGFDPSVKLVEGLSELVEWGQSVSALDRFSQAYNELESHGLVQSGHKAHGHH